MYFIAVMHCKTYQINKTKPWVVRALFDCVTVQIFGDPPSEPVVEHHSDQICQVTCSAPPFRRNVYPSGWCAWVETMNGTSGLEL